jgi:hypothetical protein
MKRKREAPGPRWTIDAYETDGGETPAWSFIRQLEGRDKIEAIALVKLLEEQGSQLRRPQSGALGIPPRTLARMRDLQTEVARRGAAPKIREAKRLRRRVS